MPHVFLRFDRAIGIVKLLLPLPEVVLLRQLAGATQRVEHGGIGRGLVQHAGIEIEQRTKRGVVENQFAVGIEDGNAGCELIEHATVRLDHVLELAAHGLGLGAVDSRAGGALNASLAARCVDHVEDAAFAGNDRRQPFGKNRAGRARARDFVARAAVEQFEFARNRVGRVDGLDRACISAIGENQMVLIVARPYRRRQRIRAAPSWSQRRH